MKSFAWNVHYPLAQSEEDEYTTVGRVAAGNPPALNLSADTLRVEFDAVVAAQGYFPINKRILQRLLEEVS